ncbi:MAG: DUF4166 domain-containing protein [Caulobacter sp.]|nr:DUF4166 domain-containing protein [Caulobacter sp.]
MARVLANDFSGPMAFVAPGPAALDFRRLLGREAWDRLPLAVQHRFGPHAEGASIIYDGRMVVEASLFGRLVAQLCRLIGTPLAPWTGPDVPTSVDVHLDHRGGLVWARTYSFYGRAPVLVSSTKLMDADGSLLEVVRGGLGMALTVSVEEGALHFRSRYYFAGIGPLRLRIPDILTPGRAHVVHRDRGGGTFVFSMDFNHPWLGRTLFQEGVFRDPK